MVATELLPAHPASLFPKADATLFPSGAFIGQHGFWNCRPHSGYKVVFLPFAGGYPADEPMDTLIGFLSAEGNALGRPVGVAIDQQGALVVADVVGNKVWRVTTADIAMAR